MSRIIVAVLTIMFGCGVTAAAQPGVTPAPTSCPDCVKAGADAAPLRSQIQQREAELRQLQQEQAANNANLNNLRRMRTDAARDGDTEAVKAHDQSIQDLQADNKGNREQQFKTREEIRSLNEELERIGRDVDACNERCGMKDMKLPTGTVVNPQPETPATELPAGSVGVPPLRTPPPCDDCKERVEELEREHKELERRAERANNFRRESDLRDFEEQRRRVRDLQRQVDDCNKQCTPPEKVTSFLTPPVIGGVAGGAVLVALLAGGGGDAPVVATPIANQPQPPQPPPPQQPPSTPAPPPRTAATGRYRCTQTQIVADPGRHNPTLRLGDQLTGDLTVTEQGNTITIRHAPPFIDIVNATFDPATGRFAGTTRGGIAGFSNVGVSFEGTYDAATGRIQLNYTLGIGGEFPGGQPITYGFTLQRQ